MARPAVVVALPKGESGPVLSELADAGFEALEVASPGDLETVLAKRADIGVAILDGETDFDESLEYYSVLHDGGRSIPTLMVVSSRSFDRLVTGAKESAEDEYLTRPYSAESMRWRIEAMCIRSQTVDDGSGPILQNGPMTLEGWSRRATIVVVFNPKGGVGKTTIATNLASTLQIRRGRHVLLVDADTVTGHVSTSLGIDAVRTVADSWQDEAEGGSLETLTEIAAAHPSGMRVVSLTDSPLEVEILDPERVAAEIQAARTAYDVIVIDLHPSYSELNRAIFEIADRILVPVTPDVPAIRAAVQLRDVAQADGLPGAPRDGREPRQQRRRRPGHGADRRDARPRAHPLGWPALRPCGQRGSHRHRDVPQGTDHRRTSTTSPTPSSGSRPPRRSPAKPGLRLFARQKEVVSA